jgi:hypothetical protein
LSKSSQKYRIGIRDLEEPYSGSRIRGSKRHQIPDPDPQHWVKNAINVTSEMVKTNHCTKSIKYSDDKKVKNKLRAFYAALLFKIQVCLF